MLWFATLARILIKIALNAQMIKVRALGLLGLRLVLVDMEPLTMDLRIKIVQVSINFIITVCVN